MDLKGWGEGKNERRYKNSPQNPCTGIYIMGRLKGKNERGYNNYIHEKVILTEIFCANARVSNLYMILMVILIELEETLFYSPRMYTIPCLYFITSLITPIIMSQSMIINSIAELIIEVLKILSIVQ